MESQNTRSPLPQGNPSDQTAALAGPRAAAGKKKAPRGSHAGPLYNRDGLPVLRNGADGYGPRLGAGDEATFAKGRINRAVAPARHRNGGRT